MVFRHAIVDLSWHWSSSLFKAFGFLSNGLENYLESSEPLRSDARFPGPIKCTPLSLCGAPSLIEPIYPSAAINCRADR